MEAFAPRAISAAMYPCPAGTPAMERRPAPVRTWSFAAPSPLPRTDLRVGDEGKEARSTAAYPDVYPAHPNDPLIRTSDRLGRTYFSAPSVIPNVDRCD